LATAADLNLDHSKRRLYRDAARAVALGLWINIALAAAKLIAGFAGNSFALLSDAANSVGDVCISTAVLFALWFAQRPADREHPYGHTKAEAIAGLSVSLLVAVSALAVGWSALWQLEQGAVRPAGWTVWVAAGNVLTKELLFWYTRHIGRTTGSLAVQASAWDHRSDAFCSLAVLVGLCVARFAGPQYLVADTIAALVVVAAVLWSAIRLFSRSVHELMDVQAEQHFLDRVREAALQVAGVEDIETLHLRKSGLEFFADIHVEVDGRITVDQGHRIGHHVKDELIRQFPRLRDVLVHIEPHEPHIPLKDSQFPATAAVSRAE